MRKKTALLLALLTVLSALCACGAQPTKAENPVSFYYCDFSASHGGGDGVLACETVDLGGSDVELETLLSRYFRGPQSPELSSPFPEGLCCEKMQLDGETLSLWLSEEYSELSGVWLSLTNACLVRTLTQFSFVSSVRIENGGMLTAQTDAPLTEDSFLFADTSVLHPEQTVTLWLVDAESGLLRAQSTSISVEDTARLPAQTLEALFAASTYFPEGTACVELSVQGGFCVAVLSEAFLQCEENPDAALLAVRSVVATLCALEQIERVQLSVQGGEIAGLDLADPMQPQEEWYARSE